MERVNRILTHNYYKECLEKLMKYEEKREFCRHDLKHFLDCARITYILNLENNLGIDKEIIYALGLLHDIGRWKEYSQGIPHNIASCQISEGILIDCGFLEGEIKEINDAILKHRKNNISNGKGKLSLQEIFYKGDKLSRNCFECKSIMNCNWSDEKKNLEIDY